MPLAVRLLILSPAMPPPRSGPGADLSGTDGAELPGSGDCADRQRGAARRRHHQNPAADQRRDEYPQYLNQQRAHLRHLLWPGLGFVGAGLGLTIARYIGAIATIWVLMVGLNPALRLSLKGYFKPFNFAIIWEVMGIGIPASIESVLFNGGKLLTQMFVAGMGTNVIAGNFIAFSVASLINLPGNALGSASTIITGKRLGKRADWSG